MNRRSSDRLSADGHDLVSKQRIVRRKVHRSPSPQIPRSGHREVRTSSANNDVYSKMGSSHRSQKYDLDFRPSPDLRDERFGGSKDHRFTSRHHSDLDIDDSRAVVGRSITAVRKDSTDGAIHHNSPTSYHDKFEFSLHVTNLNTRLTDGEAKMNLFREFKRFGFVNIKVIGFGKDRHAFINFTRLDDARVALSEMDNSSFFGQNLEVTWSRSTISRYSDILNGSQHERRSGIGLAKSHSFQGAGSLDFYNQGGGRNSDHFQDSPRSSRDISFHNSPPVHSRNHTLHSSKDTGVKNSGAIVDPNATRTLFVGNLESDITERELRDLFGPYGRIESVDIKVQRAISTAYAFVKFFTITNAMNAKNDMHGRKYGNIKLKIGFGKGSPSAKVWVGNLTSFADLSEIRSELDRFGLIRRVDYNNGDNHAFVHFDNLEAAQTAVSSLATYRFRSTNRPLKIDLSQPVHRTGSDFEDFESDFHDLVPSVGTGNTRRVHSYVSPESNSHGCVVSRRGGMSMSDEYHHQFSRNDEGIDSRIGVAIKGSFRSNRGRRVVTEVREPSHSRHSSHDEMNYANERNNYRKRVRSPDMDDMEIEDHRRAGGMSRQHFERDGANFNGGGPRMGSSHNGDLEYRPKRPKNGFDAYQYHKLHGNRSTMSERIGPISSASERERDKDYRDKDLKDRANGRDRPVDRRDRRNSRGMDRDQDHRSSSVKSERKNYQEEMENTNANSSNLKNNIIEKVSPPPPPPPMMNMMSYETADPALKLNDSTGPVSPTGVNQEGVKPDSKVETLSDMARVYPVVWHGNLVLKNTGFPTRMHLIGGDPAVAELLVRCKDPKDEFGSLRITQRLRLEPPRLEEVNKRMTSAGPSGHCILLALPGAIPNYPVDETGENSGATMQLRPLKSLVSYLDQKEAAGIVALNTIDVSMTTVGQRESNIIGVLHAFPPCEFSQSQLLKIAPNLGTEPAKDDHVVVLLVKGSV